MTPLLSLLRTCGERGLSLAGQEDCLVVRAPAGALDDELVDQLRRFKQELLSRLRAGAIFSLDGEPDTAPDAPGGAMPLLPNNYWFFKRKSLNHWNASGLFETGSAFTPELLRAGIAALLAHHDGLRSKWIRQGSDWSVRIQPLEEMAPWWREVDLSETPDAELKQAIENACDAQQHALDIEQVLFCAVRFNLGPKRNARLMLAMHHLIVDGFSIGILFQDLLSVLHALAAGLAPQLAPKTASVRTLSHFMHRHTRRLDLAAELRYWRERPWRRSPPLPQGKSEAAASDGGSALPRSAVQRLDTALTARLEDLPSAYPGIALNHVLIAALALAWREWTGGDALILNLVHHGRTLPDGGTLDLSRTVAWVSNYANYVFDLAGCADGMSAVLAVKRQYEELVGREVHFTLLRYMHPDAEVRSEMAAFPEHRLEFNFIPRQGDISLPVPATDTGNGGWDGALRFTFAPESPGPQDGPMHAGFTPFSMAFFEDEHLVLRWTYCASRFSQDEFEAFARMNAQQLKTLVEELSS